MATDVGDERFARPWEGHGSPAGPPPAPAAQPLPPLGEETPPSPAPWDVARRFATLPRLLFLDSALRHADLGRHSFVAADPFRWIEARGRQVRIDAGPAQDADPFA